MAFPTAGDTVGERYRLDTLLGDGGFGEVWKAADLRLAPRAVAIKFLKVAVQAEPTVLDRFGLEAQALSCLSHPNIISIIDRGEQDGRHYIVMEYLDGQTLDAWLDDHRDKGAWPDPRQAVSIFDQIASAIEAAHNVKQPGPILHRDIKPQNIYLVNRPQGDEPLVKVMDFGLAQLGGRQTTPTGMMLGTPAYMAPEQAFGAVDAVSPATDVFSLGVLLIEILTLEMQPSSQTPWWLEVAKANVPDADRFVKVRPELPQSIWEVVTRALNTRPVDRFQTAGEMRRAMQPLRHDLVRVFRTKPRVMLGKIDSLKLLEQEVDRCQKCQLGGLRKSPAFSRGSIPAKVMFIGEAPGVEEDRTGIPFVGPAGQLLDRMISAMGLSLDEVYTTNVIKCRPPENRFPEPEEVSACADYWKEQIRLVAPRFIVSLGKAASSAILDTALPISKLRGRWHRYQEIPLVVTFHPAYLLRNPDDKIKAWQDLQMVMLALNSSI